MSLVSLSPLARQERCNLAKILLVEDHQNTAHLISDWLTMEGHVVDVRYDGLAALELSMQADFDLFIFDLDLPGLSGLEIVKNYRARAGTAPILILTAYRDIQTKAHGFAEGADDFLTKPFQIEELSMRVSALLRRPPMLYVKILKSGNLELDISRRLLKIDNRKADLDPLEFALLEFFMRNPNHVFSADEILDKVWPVDSGARQSAFTTCLKRLRKKIDGEGDKSRIRSVYGSGYCFDVEG